MKYEQAYKIALENSEKFRKHVADVLKHSMKETKSACMAFSIGDEAFYLGFDGCEMQAGKYSAKRAAFLINNGNTLVIDMRGGE